MAIDKNGQVWPATDLDLNTSADLPACPVDVGMDFDSLSPPTRKALTTGYEVENYDPNQSLDGGELGEKNDPNPIDPRGYPKSGFVRPEAVRKENFPVEI